MTRNERAQELGIAGLILAGSLLIKLGLILHVGDGVNGDVIRAVRFGFGIREGIVSIDSHVMNTKTWVGPVLWYSLFDAAGPYGLKLFNALAFIAVFIVQYFSGRHFYDRRTRLIALFLFAFYVGSHRNVMAGESDDMLAALLFAIGLLSYQQVGRASAASVLMGLGFLFKFWTAIFFGGFFVYLLQEKRWKESALAALAFLVPFAVVNLLDGFASLSALLWSIGIQSGFSGWDAIGWRLLSTGLLPAVLASGWSVIRDPRRVNRLFFFVPGSYVAYVLIMRDAFAASAVMMLCMVYFGFLIAEFLVRGLSAQAPYVRRRALAAVLVSYAVISAGLAAYGTERSAYPLVLPSREALPELIHSVDQ